MRTWLSKANGYVTEKPNDSFTGVFTNAGEMIYEGDLITVTKITTKYIGKHNKYGGISDKEYHDPRNWETVEKRYSGIVYYFSGRYFIDILSDNRINEFTKLYGSASRIEIYHDMNSEGRYNAYKIEF